MYLDEFIKELKTKYPNANYESILKMVGTIYGKQENSKQILRASWVFDVCWHVHNKSGTMFKYAKEAKIPTTQTIKNYVKTKHYKENYKLFMGRDWLDLKAIKDGKDPVDQHVKNCNAIIISDLGKKLMNVLIVNGGQYPLIDPKHKEEDYLKELKKVMTEPGHDPGPLDDWGSFEDFSNDPEYLRDKKSKENYFKGKYKK